MNNSLVKIREVRGELRMRREDIKLFEDQTMLLMENLSRVIGYGKTVDKFPLLVESFQVYKDNARTRRA